MSSLQAEIGPISRWGAWVVVGAYVALILLTLFGRSEFSSLTDRACVGLAGAVFISPLLIGAKWLGNSLRVFTDRVEVQNLLGRTRTHHFEQLATIKCAVGLNGSSRIVLRFKLPGSRRTQKVEISDSRDGFWHVADVVSEAAARRGVDVNYGVGDEEGLGFWRARDSSR